MPCHSLYLITDRVRWQQAQGITDVKHGLLIY
uniref:Uncharacterized protein n=1 Tax=Arundo donax TaxID=35708 RepID=A0A0A9QC04_ARUDO